MKAYVGIDIGGTNTKIALVDSFGKYSSLSRIYYDNRKLSIDSFLGQVVPIVEKISEFPKEVTWRDWDFKSGSSDGKWAWNTAFSQHAHFE